MPPAALKVLAVNLSKMCNDLRMVASGPKAGLAEIKLPDRQPGSSIMPGKVNPVIAEVCNQACFNVIGNDVTIAKAAEAGQLELNVFEPVLFKNLFESIEIMANACHTLRLNAIDGIKANKENCLFFVELLGFPDHGLCPAYRLRQRQPDRQAGADRKPHAARGAAGKRIDY